MTSSGPVTVSGDEAPVLETRFVRPPQPLLDAAVDAALATAGVRSPRDDWQWVEHGSNSVVVLAGPAAVRVARDTAAARQLSRSQDLVDALPSLPFEVPVRLADAVETDGVLAIATRRLAGEPHPPASGDPAVLRELLAAVHAIDLGAVRPHLAPARSFMGGDGWQDVLRTRVVPLLAADVRPEALRRIDALAGLDAPGPVVGRVVNHGDLAGSNVLWRGGRVVGVLDWDLTAADDPAEDTASLLGWHGWQLGPQLADADTLRRATVFRDSFPLQLLAHALVHRRPQPELDRVRARVVQRLRSS